ncbi:MAG: zinc-ribbon domain-containing protein [Phormidesmis sp.]
MADTASYRYDLDNFQRLYLSNQSTLTTVTISSNSAGQQQQSSQGITTGQWTALPQLYRLESGYVATVFADQTFYILIQGNQIQMSAGAHEESIAQQINQLDPLPMQPAKPPSVPTMKPMTPLQPMSMTMGNMSMRMGEMQMGNMSIGTQASSSWSNSQPGDTAQSRAVEEPSSAARQRKFCSQCGAVVGAQDRFCSQCGTQLT